MRRLAPLFLAFALALTGCGTPTEPLVRISLGDPFWLGAGRTAVAADGAVAVRFVRVAGDSRCPIDALCIWAGDVMLDLGVTLATEPEVEVRLNAYTEPRSAIVGGYAIEVLGVEPATRTWEVIPAASYRVQLRVTAVR